MNKAFILLSDCKKLLSGVGILCASGFIISAFFFSSCRQNDKEDTTYYNNIFNDVDHQYKSGHPVAARYYLDSVFSRNAHTPLYELYRKYHTRSEWYHIEHKHDSSNIYIDSMITLLEVNHFQDIYPAEYTNALNSKGDFYFDTKNLAKAFEFYSKSRLAAQTINDSCSYGNQSYHLGMVTYRQEKYAEAISYFEESLIETKVCTDNEYRYFRLEELYSNIGLAYVHLEKYDSAALHFKMAMDFTEQDRIRINMPYTQDFSIKATGVILGNLAKVYIAQNKLDTAEQMLQKSIVLNDRPNFDPRDAMYSRMQLAELYYSRDKRPQTIEMLTRLDHKLDSLPDSNLRLRMFHLQYLYNKKTDPVSSLQYLEGYLAMKDSLDISAKKLKQTDYGQLLKNQETQYQIKLLRKDNELKQLYLALAGGLVLFTIVIIFFVYGSYRRSRQNVKSLMLLNKQVNEQKKQVEATLDQLSRSNNDKDRILHVVAHDLRNPVSAVVSLINIMQDEDRLTEDQKEMLQMMRSASDNSLMLIGEILEFSDDKLRNPVTAKELEDINEVAKQATGILNFKASEKNQVIDLSLFSEPLYVLAHPGKLGRVLGNLISNAIKFSPGHSRIGVTITKRDSNVIIEVKDNGIGIPEKDKPVVFNTFTQAKRHGTSGEVSFGLGLSICKQIVEAADGKIWFESREGRGSTFFIELPLNTHR